MRRRLPHVARFDFAQYAHARAGRLRVPQGISGPARSAAVRQGRGAMLIISLYLRDLDRATTFSVAVYLTKSPTADKIRALVLERFAPPMLLP